MEKHLPIGSDGHRSPAAWFEKVEERLSDRQKQIGSEVIKELRKRIGFLMQVGWTTWPWTGQPAVCRGASLSVSVWPRKIGSQLVNVLYILTNPLSVCINGTTKD